MYKCIEIYKSIAKSIVFLLFFVLWSAFPVLASEPSSTNYKLESYSFGAGGTSGSSTNFKLNGVAGEIESGQPGSTNFNLGSGLSFLENTNVPPAPTFTNPSSYYNKLQLQINTGSNPSDTTYAIKVVSSGTQYVQANDTLGSTPVFQTNSVWGSGGFTIIGLNSNTSYTASVTAMQGNYSQSPYGPTATVSTSQVSFTFSLSANSLTFPQLVPGTVQTSTSSITTTVSTNGTGGTTVYAYDANAGLTSSSRGYTISAVSANLASSSEGYGLQDTSVGQSSGGPIEKISPYNGTSNTVGTLGSTKQPIFDSTAAPVTTGTGTFQLQAKASITAKPATDYADTVTVVGAATF